LEPAVVAVLLDRNAGGPVVAVFGKKVSAALQLSARKTDRLKVSPDPERISSEAGMIRYPCRIIPAEPGRDSAIR
jgi:hypothetical protein